MVGPRTDSNDCSKINETNHDGKKIPRVYPSCTGPLADLTVDRDVLKDTVKIEHIAAPKDACFVEEGCLGGTGTRKVLRFSTRVLNIGCAPFVVGVPSGYKPGCIDTTGNINDDDDDWPGQRIGSNCPPATPPPPPSPPTPPPPLPGQRRLAADGASDAQQPPPSFDPGRRPNPDGSYAWGDNQWKGGFNTSNSFNN
eukprot:scaffold49364_cov48-Phaeocystis_antarctica.AAC.2